MIKQLRKKFVFISMVAVTVLMIIVIGAINVFNLVMVNSQTDRMLDFIVHESMQGPVPDKPDVRDFGEVGKPDIFNKPMNEDTFMSSRWFAVYFKNGEIVKTDVSRVSAVDESKAMQIATELLADSKARGYEDGFKFVCAIVDTASPESVMHDSVMAFLDVSDLFYNVFFVLAVSLIIGVIAWFLMLLLVIALSARATKPIFENIENQKQFITNAGHEIKTPLAIILANTDALELHQGESKWSANIKTQTKRLSGLMQNLLLLSKTDEGVSNKNKTPINASALLNQLVESYREPAAENGKTISCSVEDNVTLDEIPDTVRQIMETLIDNAVKYAVNDSVIFVDLKTVASKLVFKIKNTCEGLPEAAPEKLFDRFYRADSARTQSVGGYGIGLSVAKAATESNGGTITAKYYGSNEIEFIVTI